MHPLLALARSLMAPGTRPSMKAFEFASTCFRGRNLNGIREDLVRKIQLLGGLPRDRSG